MQREQQDNRDQQFMRVLVGAASVLRVAAELMALRGHPQSVEVIE
jgi:hypothetical protein